MYQIKVMEDTLFNPVRRVLHVGYTFMFKDEHCTITGFKPKYFTYSTASKPDNNYMEYGFFATTPHFKSKHKIKYSQFITNIPKEEIGDLWLPFYHGLVK